MKVAPRNIDNFLKQIPLEIKAVLIYGMDLGLVNERIQTIIKYYLQEEITKDSVINIFDESLKTNPHIIEEEAYTDSLFGGSKKILVLKEAKDSYKKHIESYLENPNEDILIIIQSKELGSTSTLRKLSESSKSIATIACYHDTSFSLKSNIIETLSKNGFNIAPDALNYLINNLGNDRGISKNETNKLMLYKGNQNKNITLEDVLNITDNNSNITLDKFIYSLFSLENTNSYNYLLQLFEEDTNAINILRAIMIHCNKLLYVKSLAFNMPLDLALKELKPPIFFMYLDPFKKHLEMWNTARLKNMLDYLIKLEITLKTENKIANLIIKDLVIKHFQRR